MFERFTAKARQVIVLAQDEARALNHNYIGTEHILLGLVREKEGFGRTGAWIACNYARGRACSGRPHRGFGRRSHYRPNTVHTSRQEGPGSGAARGSESWSQLHRDGA